MYRSDGQGLKMTYVARSARGSALGPSYTLRYSDWHPSDGGIQALSPRINQMFWPPSTLYVQRHTPSMCVGFHILSSYVRKSPVQDVSPQSLFRTKLRTTYCGENFKHKYSDIKLHSKSYHFSLYLEYS